VGIAGVQTGVYPAETPGGWRLIGRTPIKPFDLSRPDPFLLKAGDTVRFHPIDHDEYLQRREAAR
jgi:inhibitor of KinA